jgi:hypothetical protein
MKSVYILTCNNVTGRVTSARCQIILEMMASPEKKREVNTYGVGDRKSASRMSKDIVGQGLSK